ncbi:hypothetical protein BOTBODRAFT_130585 [Botryobasidium botryosum FD-172 SS1]|uniref:HIT domain-containing protein n=1 Tax=Botryobasidium botryosum (strain FD-172 SS1) TaxID=930990 RepID=A0A067MME0_BOTB1|nr:hypothetical protein BOTBODRAFT_130585 [Botryobasidium botryosum FD-172 SS1]
MFESLTSCIKPHPSPLKTEGQLSIPLGCTFCDVSKEKGFNIIAEDETLVVFRDRRPAALHHLLVVPKEHIGSVRELRKEHLPLLEKMGIAGRDALSSLGAPLETQRFGFHIPPFNSVDHLHLHAQVLPYKNRMRAMKYPYRSRADGGKAWTWFAELEQVKVILGHGGKVGIMPC